MRWESDYFLSPYPPLCYDEFVGSDEVRFRGRLNIATSVQRIVFYRSFLGQLSLPDFMRWGSDYVFSPYPFMCYDELIGSDGIRFGGYLNIDITVHSDPALLGLLSTC